MRTEDLQELVAIGTSPSEWLIRALSIVLMIGGSVSAFCAGATWARMQAADTLLSEARALHEQAVEDDLQSSKLLQGLQKQHESNHGSRDAGQMSSL